MSIIDNRKATHDYFIEDRYEAGMVLEVMGSEGHPRRPRAIEGKLRHRARWRDLPAGHDVSPLPTASTHVRPDATRTRKLLLKAEEIRKLIGKVEQRGYTLVPLNLHYKNGRISWTSRWAAARSCTTSATPPAKRIGSAKRNAS